MDNRSRMVSGKLYKVDEKTLRDYRRSRDICRRYNRTAPHQVRKRSALLLKLLGRVGKNATILPNFRCDYGYNIAIGDNFYANYDLIILDVAPVAIGDNVFIAPRVGIFTAGHPIDKDVRNSGLEFGHPITIGNDVWIGGNVTINPGVTIGNNVVIGSGSVVVKDIPDGSIAVGSPCRVIRSIGSADAERWKSEAEEYFREEERQS